MRQIQKGSPPRCLIEANARPGSTYDDVQDKHSLRQALVADQRGLCCYCLRRIVLEAEGFLPTIKIAHWNSQREFPEQQLSYRNLLGACKGGEGMRPSMQHCDTYQRDRKLKWSPAEPNHPVESTIYFGSDGAIYSTDAEFNDQLHDVLHLNLEVLKTERRFVLDAFLKSLGTKQLARKRWERILEKENGENYQGELGEHCQIVVWWLRKKLSRL